MKKLVKRLVLLLAVLALVGGGVYWFFFRNTSQGVVFRTSKVARDGLLVTINATGTIEPEEVIDVGAQVAGQIVEFGDDQFTPDDPVLAKRWAEFARRQETRKAASRPRTGDAADLMHSGRHSRAGAPEPEAATKPASRPVGKKVVDYGSIVEEGMLLAKIDDTVYQADLQSAQADVSSARADQASAIAARSAAKAAWDRSVADLGQLKAKQVQADRDWARAQLMDKQALADTQRDAYEAAAGIAGANVRVGERAIEQAKAAWEQASAAIGRADAAVERAEAALIKARRNAAYCRITSPVKGVIIDRRVNIGQTVVASLNAPSLFLIAKDLRRMEIWVAVNEADISQIYPGQPVTFTVDAFPGETFEGMVLKKRNNATMTQNVVTYTVEVLIDNSDGRLLPYLTADVRFETARRADVLLVPNAALRWSPTPEQVSPAYRDRYASGESKARRSKPGTGASRPSSGPSKGQTRAAVLWVPDGEFVKPVDVRAGLSDSTNTEVRGEGVTEGMDVVVGSEARTGGGDGRSPFIPQFPRGPGGGRGH